MFLWLLLAGKFTGNFYFLLNIFQIFFNKPNFVYSNTKNMTEPVISEHGPLSVRNILWKLKQWEKQRQGFIVLLRGWKENNNLSESKIPSYRIQGGGEKETSHKILQKDM